MKTVLKLLLLSVFFVSCGEADTVVYDGGTSNKTLLSFDADIYNLPVKIDDTGSVDITITSSTKSDEDRVINISRVDADSNADEAVYDLPATVTIPAGEYSGTFTVNGVDNNLTTAQTLVIAFSSSDEGVVFDSDTATINIAEVCPIIRDEFLGTYDGEELPGPYNYVCEVTAGTGPMDLIISNVWEAGASTKTKITLAGEFDSNVIFPPYLENFLFTHPTYGSAYVEPFSATGAKSTVDACVKKITLYFRVRVSAGTFEPNTLTLQKQ